MVFNYYSSLNDFGTSASKNIRAQKVDDPLPILVNKSDTALNKKSILNPPYVKLKFIFKRPINGI
jgi:hypothetical protein